MKFRKKIIEMFRKFLGNYTLNLGKVCRKCVEFQNKYRVRLKVKILEL